MSQDDMSRRRMLQGAAVLMGAAGAAAQKVQEAGDVGMMPAGGDDGGSIGGSLADSIKGELSVYGDGTYGDEIYGYQ